MDPAKEREHVMLTQAVELDVAHDDHLVVVDIENGLIDKRIRVHPVSCKQLVVHARHALRRAFQALSVHVLPKAFQKKANGLLDLRLDNPYLTTALFQHPRRLAASDRSVQ